MMARRAGSYTDDKLPATRITESEPAQWNQEWGKDVGRGVSLRGARQLHGPAGRGYNYTAAGNDDFMTVATETESAACDWITI
jgi:hypothetical protein